MLPNVVYNRLMGKLGNAEIKDGFMKIRVPRDLKEKIKRMARANRRTIPNEALVLLELAINTHRAN